jgi:hypothetical protein
MEGEVVEEYRGYYIYTMPIVGKNGNGYYVGVGEEDGTPVDEATFPSREEAVGHGRAIVDGCVAHNGEHPSYSLDVNGEVTFGWD